MAELLVIDPVTGDEGWFGVAKMRLYCWHCRTVHEFLPTDVEKIVYALLGRSCTGPPPIPNPLDPAEIPCLIKVQDSATHGEFMHFADLSVDNRCEASDG